MDSQFSRADPRQICLAAEAAELGFWDCCVESHELDLDARCRLVLGLPLTGDLVRYEQFLERLHSEDRLRIDDALHESFRTGEPLRIEFRTAGTSHESVRWVSVRGRSNGHDRLLGIMEDVTARHSALEEHEYMSRHREEAAARLDTLLNQAPVGIGFWDAELRFERVNQALAEIHGVSIEAHVGQTIGQLAPSLDLQIAASLERVRKTQEPLSLEISGETRGHPGVKRHWNLTYYPVRVRDRFIGIGAICDEVTDRKDAEQRLAFLHRREKAAREDAERLNRVKDEFLSTVSHELRTPLQSILGWARMLREEEIDPKQVRRGIEVIERNASAQAKIIDDILDVSRIISGKVRIARQSVSMATVIQFALETVRPAAIAKNITLNCSLRGEMDPIVADEDKLKQVMWNLLSNAIKFSNRGATVHVSVGKAEGFVEIVVRDSGRGIRNTFLPYVFERFRQADGATTRAHGGLGLGLAIVRHLVELHGGTVIAESEGDGHGATFTVRLPMLSPPPSEREIEIPIPVNLVTKSRKTPVKPLEGLRVLVTDDEQDARDLLAIVLDRNGASTFVASSAKEALAAIDASTFDVLVSDIGMPGEDGYALARAVAGRDRRPRVSLALTAYARAEDRRAALAAGFDGHVAKPVDPTMLVTTVLDLLAAHRAAT